MASALSALEARGVALAARHGAAAQRASQLRALPTRIAALEADAAALAAAQPAEPHAPALGLPLADTAALLCAREAECVALRARVAGARAGLPRRERDAERVAAELLVLQERKRGVVVAALEARRRREEGGVDELEERGRWFRAAEMALANMLGVEA